MKGDVRRREGNYGNAASFPACFKRPARPVTEPGLQCKCKRKGFGAGQLPCASGLPTSPNQELGRALPDSRTNCTAAPLPDLWPVAVPFSAQPPKLTESRARPLTHLWRAAGIAADRRSRPGLGWAGLAEPARACLPSLPLTVNDVRSRRSVTPPLAAPARQQPSESRVNRRLMSVTSLRRGALG